MSATLQITEGGKVYNVNYKFLEAISNNIPEGHDYDDLANELLSLDIPSITENLIHREELTVEQYDTLWKKGNIDIKRSIAENKTFLQNLSDEQAEEIITLNDPDILRSIANWAEVLYPQKDYDDEPTATRLSGAMADKLLQHLSNHEDSSVRQELFENSSAPAKFIPPLATMLKTSSRRIPINAITADDLPTISKLSHKALGYIASNIEDIKNAKLRKEICKLILAHPDPFVRMQLAENRFAPVKLLKALLKDKEPDVVQEATSTLRSRDELDELDDDE